MSDGRLETPLLSARLTRSLHPGVWLSLVERLVRDQEVAGSNPVTPTRTRNDLCKVGCGFF